MVDAAGRETLDAALIVTTAFETMGLLVYRKIAPVDLVMDLADGTCASTLSKLEKSILNKREQLQQPSWAEWYEWLARLAMDYKSNDTSVDSRLAPWRR